VRAPASPDPEPRRGSGRTDTEPDGARPDPAQRRATPSAAVRAPGFTLPDQHGAPVALARELRDRAALIVFYPFAFSGVCGSELQALQGARGEFDTEQVALLAVSCDPLYALRTYADREGFGFRLLSDFWPHGATARDYGVFDEERGCARRGSFLVDQEGLVRWSLVNPISEPRPLEAYREAVEDLLAAR
jgi:mycoredoxin-dependent peroxiredoxin